MRKAGGNPLEYPAYLHRPDVVSSGSHDGEIASRETVELFSTVKQEYVVQNQQGGSVAAITAGYDFKANKANLTVALFRPGCYVWLVLLF